MKENNSNRSKEMQNSWKICWIRLIRQWMQWPNECSSPRFEIMFSYSCSIISTGALVASSVLSKVLWCLLQQHYSWIKSIKTTRTSNLLVPYFKDMTVLMLKIMSWVFHMSWKFRLIIVRAVASCIFLSKVVLAMTTTYW